MVKSGNDMKVCICQTSPRLLDLEANLVEVEELIIKGRKEGMDLVVFPELALTGYFVAKQYHEVALRQDSQEVARLARASKGTAAIVGYIEETHSMNFYNSALVLVDGEVLYSFRKLNLPNYGDFEERKIFTPGNRVQVFHLHGYTLAVLICNDMWHPSLPYLAITQEADILVAIINSSLDAMGEEFSNIESWEIINKAYSRMFGIYLICANRAGVEIVQNRMPVLIKDGLEKLGESNHEKYVFWGGSEVINPFGQSIAKASFYESDTISVELDREMLRRKRILLPYLRQDDPFFTLRELERILIEKETGKPKQPGL
jgi:predicted amidohydrolase